VTAELIEENTLRTLLDADVCATARVKLTALITDIKLFGEK